MKKQYYAAVDGFILGAVRTKGDSLGRLTEDEAKYPVMSGRATDVPPPPPPPADAPASDDTPASGRKAR